MSVSPHRALQLTVVIHTIATTEDVSCGTELSDEAGRRIQQVGEHLVHLLGRFRYEKTVTVEQRRADARPLKDLATLGPPSKDASPGRLVGAD